MFPTNGSPTKAGNGGGAKIRHGQRVTVGFDDIYDYRPFKPDGTETGKVLVRREAK